MSFLVGFFWFSIPSSFQHMSFFNLSLIYCILFSSFGLLLLLLPTLCLCFHWHLSVFILFNFFLFNFIVLLICVLFNSLNSLMELMIVLLIMCPGVDLEYSY